MMKCGWFSLAVVVVVALALLPSIACAQTTQPAASTTSASGDQLANRLLAPQGGTANRQLPAATAGPVTDASSGKSAVAPAAPTLNVLREGTFIPVFGPVHCVPFALVPSMNTGLEVSSWPVVTL